VENGLEVCSSSLAALPRNKISVNLNQGNEWVRFGVRLTYLHGDFPRQGAARATVWSSLETEGRTAELCRSVQKVGTSREALPVGHGRDAGGKFDGAPRSVLPVHARAGERAAATRWFQGAAHLTSASLVRRRSFWCSCQRERVDQGRTEEEIAEVRCPARGVSGGDVSLGRRRNGIATHTTNCVRCMYDASPQCYFFSEPTTLINVSTSALCQGPVQNKTTPIVLYVLASSASLYSA
jgi:hypothetical protein